ncbi:MAG TPA: hypothetical protein PKY97_02935, partial [Saprospiraceae bacterium]|nr:hypothetical protein [Saprospiraceae bacterium]
KETVILILSSKEDVLTSDVIAWLKKPYIRWNADDVIEEINIEIYNSKMEYELGISDLMLN